jgi:hypothetical protein
VSSCIIIIIINIIINHQSSIVNHQSSIIITIITMIITMIITTIFIIIFLLNMNIIPNTVPDYIINRHITHNPFSPIIHHHPFYHFSFSAQLPTFSTSYGADMKYQ